MPTQRVSRLGRLALKLVNDSQIVHSSGKMLKASSSTMVGATKSHASERSDRPCGPNNDVRMVDDEPPEGRRARPSDPCCVPAVDAMSDPVTHRVNDPGFT